MAVKFSPFKTKSRTFPDIVAPAPPASRTYNASGVLQSTFAAGTSLTTHQKSETITYTSHVKGEPLRDNRCVHAKTQFDYSGDPTTFDRVNILNDPGHVGWYHEYYGGHTVAVGAHPTAVGVALAALGVTTGKAVLDGAGQGYVNDAFNREAPDLTTMSLPNFLIDIGQITDLFRLWQNNVSLAKNLAGARLNYQFGWKPTIGDVANMLNAVNSLNVKLKLFRESLGSVSNRNVVMLNRDTTKSGTFNLGGNPAYKVDWRASLSGKVKVHLKFQYLPLPAMTNFETNLRGLFDVLGFELNPRIIWDAIPFSFVIDWFFGVGNWLQGFKIDALELPVSCIDASVSYKETLKVESTLFINPLGFPQGASTEMMGGCVSTNEYFDRRPFLPDAATLSGLGWRKPSFNQLTNLVSLAVVLGAK
jgi:hypothetical protein